MNEEQLKRILEAMLMASTEPLSIERIQLAFGEETPVEKEEIQSALSGLAVDCEGRSFELKEVNSGYRYQVRKELAEWTNRLWEEKPARYTRALLETLALIAYRQPITRAEIESIRGVSVSTSIVKTLQEREWVRIVGHRDVPGRPALYATTRDFLDYFNLKSLDELPPLAELKDIDAINAELDLRMPGEANEAEPPAREEVAEYENTAEFETDADDEEEAGEDSSPHEETVAHSASNADS